jgi:hypothetical protein
MSAARYSDAEAEERKERIGSVAATTRPGAVVAVVGVAVSAMASAAGVGSLFDEKVGSGDELSSP